jgi:hypothetical protein
MLELFESAEFKDEAIQIYEIKLLESNFAYLYKNSAPQKKLKTLAVCIAERLINYRDYLVNKYTLDLPQESLAEEREFTLEYLSSLRNVLMKSTQPLDKCFYLAQLAKLYFGFSDQCLTKKTGDTKSTQQGGQIWRKLRGAAKIEGADEFFAFIIQLYELHVFSEQSSANAVTNKVSEYFNNCSEDEMNNVLALLNDEQLIEHVNQLFFISLSPEKAMSQKVHSERLISIKNRAQCLHYRIEEFYAAVFSACANRSAQEPLDLLLHGDELPKGIQLNCTNFDMIHRHLANINLSGFAAEIDFFASKFNSIVRSYQFWFNPSRFVDAIAAIYSRLKKENSRQWQANYSKVIQDYFNSCTTNECLSLYGYFNNKDTKYLILTLKSLIQGQRFDWSIDLNEASIQAITMIVSLIETLLSELRITLKQRGIDTQEYSYSKPKNDLKPGKRIKSCILRFIDVYAQSELSTKSSKLEALFDEAQA